MQECTKLSDILRQGQQSSPNPHVSLETRTQSYPRGEPASEGTGSPGQGLKWRRFIIFLTSCRTQGCVICETSAAETRQKQAEEDPDMERHGIMLLVEHVMPREQQDVGGKSLNLIVQPNRAMGRDGCREEKQA